MKLPLIKIYPQFLVLLAFGVLLVPFQWLIAWLFAAFVHEVFHYIALRICGSQVYCLKFGSYGAQMEADIPSGLKMAFCAMAGPVGGLLLLPLLSVAPRVALCGLLQTLYNLLPIFPMDGGRVLAGLVTIYFGTPKGEKILVVVEYTAMICLIAGALYLSVHFKVGVYPVLFVVFVLIKKYSLQT